MKNYAFIDAQNTHLGIKSLGWKIDWVKFRRYLKEKYSVDTAYIFIGFIQSKVVMEIFTPLCDIYMKIISWKWF